MSLFIAYLLKLATCLAIGYLFYFLLLRHMTYYQWNRYYLALFPVAALVIPLLPLSLPQPLQPANVSFVVGNALPDAQYAGAQAAATAVAGFSWVNVTAWVLIAGMVLLLLRFAVRLYSLYRTRQTAKLVHNGDIRLYHIDGCTAPFSFYNSIYLDTSHYNETELDKIVIHEAIHVSQRHTVDTLFAEALCIIQWFNPFAWMMKTAIRENLEFIADDAVLQHGANRTGYQYLLLKVSGAVPHSLANNLLFPSLKKRIHMMNRERTKRSHLWKFMCLVPLGCVLLVAFSGPAHIQQSSESNGGFTLEKLVYYTNDVTVSGIVKNDRANSFLKAGKPLSLQLLKDEKTRLSSLLAKNGYSDLDNQSISFIMDSSAASPNFHVLVCIKINKPHKQTYTPDELSRIKTDTTGLHQKPTDPNDVVYLVSSNISFDKRVGSIVQLDEGEPLKSIPVHQ